MSDKYLIDNFDRDLYKMGWQLHVLKNLKKNCITRKRKVVYSYIAFSRNNSKISEQLKKYIL